MHSWAVSLLVAGLVVLSTFAYAVELPTGPTVPTAAPITFTDGSIASTEPEHVSATPSRVVPVQAMVSTRNSVRISSRRPITEDIPAGTPFAGEYIVLYRENVPDVEEAAEGTRMAAIELTASAVQTGELPLAAGSDVASFVSVMSTTPAPRGIPSQALIKVPAELHPERVKDALSATPGVKAVVRNRVVRIAQAIPEGGCTPGYFASAVEAKPIAGFSWAGCSGEGLGLAAFGERCGAAMDKFKWTGLFAYDKATGQMVANCVAFRSSEQDAERRRELFGACGVAPTKFVGLPTSACSEEDSAMPVSDACVQASALPAYSVQLSSSLCAARGASAATFTGTPCGPNNSLIRWESLNAAACGATLSRATLDAKQTADWVGQCGVPPTQITGLPVRICAANRRSQRSRFPGPLVTEDPSDTIVHATAIPRAPLAKGESTANWGMARIGALAGGRVIDAAAAAAATGIKVVVMDTGVEKTHPDLNVVEFIDLVDAEGTPDHQVDGHGHGSHVGGIIGARNQGSGVSGVVPGMPIIAFKVLGRDGSGPLDGIWKGYAQIIERLNKGEKIVAINLSLGSPVVDADSLKVECDWVRKLANYGTAIVAAAGNDGGELLTGTIPAACPDSMSITSIASDDTPSYFSNLLNSNSADNLKAKTVAAPGSSIFSTFNNGEYRTLSGTSMATPHTTGAFAACFLAGDCKMGALATTASYPKMQNAAKSSACANAKKCGPSWGTGSYYGPCISVRNW